MERFNQFLSRFKLLNQSHDILIAMGMMIILGVMLIKIPPFILDLCLSFTLAFSVMILLMAIYARRPLDFSTFPTVLLLMTLFRLSLNVASTRNILLRAQTEGESAAGEIIRAFGSFVVGGNFAVGIIIFIILVTINFIVITKGAGRVAEVGARFTLDAMPGKQMAIDADLNAGIIDDKEAKRRRSMVAAEADFYGSMDGASKFVRGDAIAGIIITIINILGGIIIGMAQYDLSFSDAGKLFTLLTVGDGLVTQIPAIIISTAAGIIITRSADDESLGKQIADQFQIHPKAIASAGAVLFIFGLIPGLPKIPFFLMGIIFFVVAYYVNEGQAVKEIEVKKQEITQKKKNAERLEELLSVELVELEVGYALVNLVDADQKGDLLERIAHIRKQFASDWGVIVPSVRIKDNLELKPGGYSIRIKGVEVAKGELIPDHLMAMDPGSVIEKIDGIPTKEPVFGLPAVWISEDMKEEAQYAGYTVVDLSTVVATHITEILKANLHEIFGRQELARILDNFKEINPKLVGDVVPDIVTTGTLLKILQGLLKEGISIRDMRTILEALGEHGQQMKESESLMEVVRQALYRTITEKIKSSQGDVPLFTLDRNIEENIINSVVQTEYGKQIAMDPKLTQNILAGLNEKIEEATSIGEKMIVLCSPAVRGYFKKLTEKFIPNLIVISHNELAPEVSIRSLGMIKL